MITQTSIDIEKRGHGIESEKRDIVEQLRSQAFAVQRHFQRAEDSALILAESLGDDENSVGRSVTGTYEAHAVETLQQQLFRLLIVDLSAAVLDRDTRTGSVSSLVQELRNEPEKLVALSEYYADTSCLEVTISGEGLDQATIERLKTEASEKSARESVQSMDAQWERIKAASDVLKGDAAERIRWARNKSTAHLQRKADGVVDLGDDPPAGEGKLTWDEPIRFLADNRAYVYDVYALVTANHWGEDHTEVGGFYARAFWDRFKNGKTALEP